ncbi:glycoside hydrolase family 3 protein [Bipolaris oryzae ATCC 44560]|uniref:beta-glucosidase n=1 Tax=Bipolaris oryzae ATCC 44560 TaxID=930090 RepID=W6Z926_COCMI|nr:glycoside hydrolase family 3 protein [Bipolaris oryzae ATCC 44560]EUC40181.1 glycoside hydrolase family 3 protein [Bipolaris oryzae ATCC 44560]
MSFISATRILLVLLSIYSLPYAQIPDGLPIDDAKRHIVAPLIKLAKFERGPELPADVSKKHQVLSAINPPSWSNIFQGATEGVVLVKNYNHTLPWEKPKMPTLYGYDAHISFKNIPEVPNTKYSIYTDSRHFDAHNITLRFEFVFGLTYTTFEYAGLNIALADLDADASALPPSAPVVQGGIESLWDALVVVKAEITNTGFTSAPEVAHLYLVTPGAPAKQLPRSEKVPLEASESTTVYFDLTRRGFSI